MTQEEVDTLFSIAITIHRDEWFGERDKITTKSTDKVAKWVARQLAESQNIYTIPVGASWGVLTTEKKFNEYWEKNNI